MNLERWLIERYGAEKFTPGLDRVQTYLKPHLEKTKKLEPTIITIAGTNGKGETALCLAEQARRAGIKYALWTSPHIESLCERFQTNDGDITAEELQDLLFHEDQQKRESGIGLSYYEILWATWLSWALRREASLWIVEVGLGGRLDAVNTLDADIVGLCSISRDHQSFLGNRYDQILMEKLGVVRAKKTLISSLELRYLREITQRTVNQVDCHWRDLFEEGKLTKNKDFSFRNRLLAREIWEELGHSWIPLENLSFRGRGESVSFMNHEFIFYGAHNPDGVRKLIHLLRSPPYNSGKDSFHHIWVAMSQRPVNDLKVMVHMIRQLPSSMTQLSFTTFDHEKADAGDGWWGQGEARFVHDWKNLLKDLDEKKPQRILVFGSYYFVSAIKSYFSQHGR